MSTQILRTSGTDFSATIPLLLVDINGYSITNPTIKVVDTASGTNFSMLRPVLLVDTKGKNI